MDDKVIDYFNKKAKNYNENRQIGVLGWEVNKEKQVVLELLNPKKGECILDAGCGAGFYSSLIKERGASGFGVDISPQMVTKTRQLGIDVSIQDLDDFNLGKKFDKILCVGALEFCRNPEIVIKNFKRHLKRNGSLVLLIPKKSIFGFSYFLFHLVHGIRIKLFSKKKIAALLKVNRFKIIKIKKAGYLAYCVLAKNEE